MPIPEALQSYAMQLGFPMSENLAGIFSILFQNPDEIDVFTALPGTAEEIAAKIGFTPEKVKEIAISLKNRGIIGHPMNKPQIFRRFPAMIELRDSTVLYPNAPQKLFEYWDNLISNEVKNLVPMLNELNVPPMVRVLPIEKAVATQNLILDVDSARKIFKEAELVTVVDCACRLMARKVGKGKNCPAPANSVCMQTNGFAQAILDRGLATKLSNEEALKRIGDAEDAGLIHVVRNNIQKDMFMCNCCSCCCSGLFFINQAGYAGAYAPSRFRVKLDQDACTGCGVCEDRCQLHAIKVGDVAEIDLAKCYGCGNCVITCPSEALSLEEVRPREFVRVK